MVDTIDGQSVSMLTFQDARAIARFFQVLADPTRVRILRALAGGRWCVSDLTRAMGMDQPAVSHQLRYLRDQGLVEYQRDGKRVYYTLADNHLRAVLLDSIDYIGADESLTSDAG
jgi:DNA-binding transcriptional ArsR family regulator